MINRKSGANLTSGEWGQIFTLDSLAKIRNGYKITNEWKSLIENRV